MMRVTTGKMRYSAASSARLTVRCVDRPEPERRRLTALGRISTFVRLRQVNTEAHPWPPVCCVHDGLPAVKGHPRLLVAVQRTKIRVDASSQYAYTPVGFNTSSTYPKGWYHSNGS